MTETLQDRTLLASEYHAMYRDAAGNLRFAYAVDHSDLFRPSCVFGPGFREKLEDLGFVKEFPCQSKALMLPSKTLRQRHDRTVGRGSSRDGPASRPEPSDDTPSGGSVSSDGVRAVGISGGTVSPYWAC